LQAVAKHRAVAVIEESLRYLNDKIRTHADQVDVVGHVVDFAQSQPVRDHGVTLGLAIGDDVGGIQQLGFVQTAHGTAFAVRSQDPGSKDGLVKSDTGEPLKVRPLRWRDSCEIDEALAFVDGNGELVTRRILLDQPYGIPRHVDASGNPNEVGKRQSLEHRRSQRSVVSVVGVGASVLVTDEAVITDVVNVRRRLIRLGEGRSDGEGGAQVCWFPDPSLHDQADWPAIEGEGVDVCRGESAVRAGLEKPIEVLEHRRPEQSI
jgi:hypothetical protein